MRCINSLSYISELNCLDSAIIMALKKDTLTSLSLVRYDTTMESPTKPNIVGLLGLRSRRLWVYVCVGLPSKLT